MVNIYAFSEESIKECRSVHVRSLDGRCTNHGLQGAWQDKFSKFKDYQFPRSLPLGLFYNQDEKLKKNGDQIQLIVNRQLVILTLGSQQCSYTNSLTSDKFSYSYLQGIKSSGNQCEWDYQDDDFSDRLQRKIVKRSRDKEYWVGEYTDELFDYDAWVVNTKKERVEQLKETIKKTQEEMRKKVEACEKEINSLNEQIESEDALMEYELVKTG